MKLRYSNLKRYLEEHEGRTGPITKEEPLWRKNSTKESVESVSHKPHKSALCVTTTTVSNIVVLGALHGYQR